MECVLCKHGDTRSGAVTATLQRGDATVIMKDVPAEVCDNCAEYYLSQDVTRQVLARAEQAAMRGAEVEILRFAG